MVLLILVSKASLMLSFDWEMDDKLWLTDWLTDWLIDWLIIDWLIDWLELTQCKKTERDNYNHQALKTVMKQTKYHLEDFALTYSSLVRFRQRKVCINGREWKTWSTDVSRWSWDRRGTPSSCCHRLPSASSHLSSHWNKHFLLFF